MSEDREMLRKVWEGRVAACITLAAEDTSILGKPDPHYLMLPRVSYFPLLLEKVRKSLQRFVTPELKDNEIWLDFKGIPLKPQYPIGALCDLLNMGEECPWRLTIHFSKLPQTIISLPTRDSLESQFLSHLKEADALKHLGAIIKTLQSKDHKQLWLGLVNDKFDQFWSINQKLMEASSNNTFRSIPLRLHRAPPLDDCTAVAPPIMRLQKPAKQDGQPMLFSDLIDDTFSDVLEEGDVLVVQGVVPPRDTPLLWLSQHLSTPDNFLHLCLRPRQHHG